MVCRSFFKYLAKHKIAETKLIPWPKFFIRDIFAFVGMISSFFFAIWDRKAGNQQEVSCYPEFHTIISSDIQINFRIESLIVTTRSG